MAVHKNKPLTIIVFFCFISVTICLELIEIKNKRIKVLFPLISNSQKEEIPEFRRHRSAKPEPEALKLNPDSKTQHGYVKRSTHERPPPPPMSHTDRQRYYKKSGKPVYGQRYKRQQGRPRYFRPSDRGQPLGYLRNLRRRTQCLKPRLISGKVRTPTLYKFGSKAMFSCQRGFRLAGPAIRVCQTNGDWSGRVPHCFRTTCRKPTLSNGHVKMPPNLKYGAKAVYRCNKPYRLVGKTTRVCRRVGKWTGRTPYCTKSVKKTRKPKVKKGPFPPKIPPWARGKDYKPLRCDTPPRIVDGKMRVSSGSNFGSKAKYSCNKGYRLHGKAIRVCQTNGAWSGRNSRCFRTTCRKPTLSNGHVKMPPNFKYGAKAVYRCNKPYRLVGKATRVCKYGRWWGRTPFCSKTLTKHREPNFGNYPVSNRGQDCKKPPSILNGYRRLPTVYRYGSKTVYSCNNGYRLVGIATHVCKSDGKWSADTPACEKQGNKDLTGQLKKISKDIKEIEESSGGKKLIIGVVITVIILLLLTCHGIWVTVTRRELDDKHNAVVKDGLIPVCDVPGIIEVSNSLCASLCCCADSDLPTTFRPHKKKKKKKSSREDLDNFLPSLSRTSIGQSKHGSLHRVDASARSMQGSLHKVGSSASRASARSVGSFNGMKQSKTIVTPRNTDNFLPSSSRASVGQSKNGSLHRVDASARSMHGSLHQVGSFASRASARSVGSFNGMKQSETSALCIFGSSTSRASAISVGSFNGMKQSETSALYNFLPSSSRTSVGQSKHGSLHRVDASARSKRGSFHKVGSSASRASARSVGSFNGMKQSETSVTPRNTGETNNEYQPLCENCFPELPSELPLYPPPGINELDQSNDEYVQSPPKTKNSSSKMDTAAAHYWNDNASMQRLPKYRRFKSSSPIYSQRLYEGSPLRPRFYEQKTLKTEDKRKTQKSRRQKNRMSPNARDSDPKMFHGKPIITKGQHVKGKVSLVKYRYKNTNTNTNTDEFTKIPLYNANQSFLTYTDYKENNCIFDSLDAVGSLKNDLGYDEDYKYNLTSTDFDFNLYLKKRMDRLEDKHTYEYIDVFDWFENYNPDLHHNDRRVGQSDKVEQVIKESPGDQINDYDARNGNTYGIFKTTVCLNTDEDQPLELKRAHNPNHDHLNEVIKNVKQTRQHEHTRVTNNVRNAELLIDLDFQEQDSNNQSKTFNTLRESVQPEDNSDSIEVIIIDSSVQKAPGNDESSQIIIDVSSTSRENLLAEHIEGVRNLNFQVENDNNSSQIVDVSRINVLPREEPTSDDNANDMTACFTDSSITLTEEVLSLQGQH